METHFTRYRVVYLGLLSALFLSAAGLSASRRLLWSDEQFTYYVANQSDPILVVRALLNGADLHPPLDYLFRYLSMQLFGASELSFRLPSILAVWITSICLYCFLSKRTGTVPAMVTFSFPLATAAFIYSSEGRGYALLLAAMSVTLLAWQRAAERPKSIGRLVCLSTSLAAAPYLHFYGILNYAPILVGEGVRSFQSGKLSAPILVSIVGSFVLLLPLYPFIENAREYVGVHAQGSFSMLAPVFYYEQLLSRSVLFAACSVVICTGVACINSVRPSTGRETSGVPLPEVAAALTICAVPFLAYLLAILFTGSLANRYTFVTICGFALLVGYVAHFAGRCSSRYMIGIMLGCYLPALFLMTVGIRNSLTNPKPAIAETVKALVYDADVPVVVSNEGDYLQLNHYLPEEARAKIVHLLDRKAVMAFRGFDADMAIKNLSRHVPLNVIEFADFTRKNAKFILLDRGWPVWLMKKLEVDGTNLLRKKSVGNFSVYLVEMAPSGKRSEPAERF